MRRFGTARARTKIAAVQLVAIALTAAAAALAPTPAAAVGDGDPVIVSPANYQRVGVGWSGPLTVDLSDAPTGSYSLTVRPMDYMDNDYDFSAYIEYDGSQDVFTYQLEPLTVAGNYDVHIYNLDIYTPERGYSHGALSWLTVLANAPRISSVTPATFYPLVKDGYRDVAKVAFSTDEEADVEVRVVNGSGTTVRRAQLGELAPGSHTWTWDGRRDDTTRVPAGGYRVRVRTVNADDRTLTSSAAPVTVATGWRWRELSKTKDGLSANAAVTRGCYAHWGYWNSTGLFLDCWGGREATGTWRFNVPASARNIEMTVVGRRYCCDGSGRFWSSWSRPSSTVIVGRVNVSGWRSYDVHAVAIWYDVKVRI